jgi:hypothetical protein
MLQPFKDQRINFYKPHQVLNLNLHIYWFETLFSTLPYVKEKIIIYSSDIDDHNTKNIFASKGTQLCI